MRSQSPDQASPADTAARPGSAGEHLLQARHGSQDRARTFYDRQLLDHLNERMREFVGHQSMMFIATADRTGACDCSFRAGPPGFVHVLNQHTLLYPEYRGNGVNASLGNISENPQVGLVFIDFFRDIIGLHVNGRAAMVEPAELRDLDVPPAVHDAAAMPNGLRPERWVQVEVEEAYIHCSKHIPVLEAKDKHIHWGTDDARRKGGDFFEARQAPRPWVAAGETVVDLREQTAQIDLRDRRDRRDR